MLLKFWIWTSRNSLDAQCSPLRGVACLLSVLDRSEADGGPMRSEIEPELLLHATQELNHAVLVVDRIIQLGGTPVLNPSDWPKFARCDYDAPVDPYVEVILQQNLKGERCAIQRYKEIADFTSGKDHTTHQMATTILNEEHGT